jgi:anaerobic magnesium-protoporphyrin IX monomethyl ester cyclase
MRISLLTVPVEPNYMNLVPEVRVDTEVFVSSIRSEGQMPVMPKIAIVSLIRWMESHGYSKEQYDFYDVDMLLPSDRELIDYFNEYQPTVVGLSAVVSTCYSQVKRIVELIRKCCPDAWIVLGGSLTASSNLVLRKTEVDVCVVGDGEIAWVNLLDYVKQNGRKWNYAQLGGIAGLAFLDEAGQLQFTGYGKAIPGEMNPFPDYDILLSGLKKRPQELANYFRRGLGSTHFQTDPRSHESNRRPVLAQLWTSKGCVARCTFCQRSTKGYRTHALQALDEHLKMLASRFDVGFVHILDENFGSDREYAHSVAEIMWRNGMLWMASGVRVSSVEYDDIKFYKEHGCACMKFGVESGSQKIMDVMEKKFAVERVFQTLKHCADLELYSPLAVMVGMPGESNETAAETGRYIGRLSYMQGIDPQYQGFSIFYALPLTGTPLYVYGQQVGIIGKSPDDEEKYLLSVSGSGASKINYVNLNGSGIKDVIWWDWLVSLEARRAFNELVSGKPLPSPNFMQRVIIADKQREIVGKALTLQQVLSAMKSFSLNGLQIKIFYFVDRVLEQHVVPSRIVALLPRWMVYPILRQVIYAQHLLQGFVLSMFKKQFNLWKKWPKIPRIDAPVITAAGVQIDRSLRRTVLGNARKEPSVAPDEKVQDTLSIGL